ncbi:hypothetical protein BMS3Abin05_02507 [bacterium BMS3Abin05]|nr:hypothetical protein BMS3Abin05_02507 [bacterium BMS3Abin05]GBE27779.1 hypothetical protein BMS3Bbin03_01708 [bacterium BMS3Bbin03]HDL77995.1 hypothetical protein [Bacteroidota bacterium]HDZ10739.1 hypothetical protein [Bacteroidota bacterium]
MKRFYWILSVLLGIWLIAGCSREKNPVTSFSHPETWMQENSADFHGQIVVARGLASCRTCHGKDFEGGDAGVSCYQCHSVFPHKTDWMEMGSPDFHGTYIQSHKYDMRGCRECHGKDYSGGRAHKACLDCHTRPGGPEACNTCHGNEKNNAPPRDLAGDLYYTAIGVGAHQTMLAAGVSCSTCHVVPDSVYAPGHIDTTRAAEVKPNLGWDPVTATCSNAGCHGPLVFTKKY